MRCDAMRCGSERGDDDAGDVLMRSVSRSLEMCREHDGVGVSRAWCARTGLGVFRRLDCRCTS
eukprot:2081991-Rhodomonas_salina.1